jgi:nucleoside-triphosphatase
MVTSLKIGITGLPNAGKTYALLKIIEMLEEAGGRVGGMVTQPIVKDGRRHGFWVTDWATKKREVLASPEFESEGTAESPGVDLEVLNDVGVRAIREATEEADIVVVDEVGKMEMESEEFVEAVKDALDSEKPVILTLHKKSRNPLLQDIRRRDDVRILEVTPVNRNLLPYKIVGLLKGEWER